MFVEWNEYSQCLWKCWNEDKTNQKVLKSGEILGINTKKKGVDFNKS